MTISAAKVEANRLNAQKSTGPRTERGKQRSSRNAVTHGLRAETLVLGEEDPQELEERREAWRACLSPADEVEQRLVDDAVAHTWMQDRARRAQAIRASANLAQFGVAQAVDDAKEVEELAQRLYKDRTGPLTFYPTDCELVKLLETTRIATTSYAGNNRDDPDRPGALVLRLHATLLGCEWMLGEWAELKAILDRGQRWLPCDKLKAVRLLGRQPLDAIDDRDVAMVFLATSVLEGSSQWFWEISTELSEPDLGQFRNNAAARKFKSQRPKDAASAREALFSIIDRATERLTLKAEIHRERARLMAALAPGLMAFDESQAGERLRRYELASGRSLSRALEDLRKHRRSSSSVDSAPLSVGSGRLSVLGAPLAVVSGEAEASAQPIGPIEPNDHWEIAPNEPTGASENAPIEPTGQRENAPIEPTGASENVTNEPTGQRENAPIEPTGASENAPNEPTGQRENAPIEPTGASENVTNEPTDPWEKALTESELASDCENAERIETGAGTDDGDFESRTYQKELLARLRQAMRKRRSMRIHELVELVEERRKATEQIMADRRAQRLKRKIQHGKPRSRPEGQRACTGLGNRTEDSACKKTELDELLITASPVYDEAKPVPC
jgi:hypothetical protein